LVAIATVTSSFFTYLNSATKDERDALRDSLVVVRARSESLAKSVALTSRWADSLGSLVRTLNDNAGNCGRWYVFLRARVDTLTLLNQQAQVQIARSLVRLNGGP